MVYISRTGARVDLLHVDDRGADFKRVERYHPVPASGHRRREGFGRRAPPGRPTCRGRERGRRVRVGGGPRQVVQVFEQLVARQRELLRTHRRQPEPRQKRREVYGHGLGEDWVFAHGERVLEAHLVLEWPLQ